MSNLRSQQALLQRQQRLLLRSAELRDRFNADLAPLQRPLELVDLAREGWSWLRVHPEVPLAAAVVLAVLRPRRAWRWGMRLWWGWRTLRRLGWMQPLRGVSRPGP